MNIECIVNGAKETLLGGGGIDGAIHKAAGNKLVKACAKLNGCKTGECKLTKGFDLPAEYVLHTVGPRDKDQYKLKACYESCLTNMLANNIKSLAFCCIAIGHFGFPKRQAAVIALSTTRRWLEKNHQHVERVIFCIWKLDDDVMDLYKGLMPIYFPSGIDFVISGSKRSIDGGCNDSVAAILAGDKKMKVEKELMDQMMKYDLSYIPPPPGEDQKGQQ